MLNLFKKNNGSIAPDKLRYAPLRFDLSGNMLDMPYNESMAELLSLPPAEW